MELPSPQPVAGGGNTLFIPGNSAIGPLRPPEAGLVSGCLLWYAAQGLQPLTIEGLESQVPFQGTGSSPATPKCPGEPFSGGVTVPILGLPPPLPRPSGLPAAPSGPAGPPLRAASACL